MSLLANHGEDCDCGCEALARDDLHREAESLRSRGALVLLPGDASPLAELVMAAVAVAQNHEEDAELALLVNEARDLHDAAVLAAADPDIRQWVERGRDVP